ncbi:MAG: hypothetical protein K2Q12_08300 [Rickettsiales bacterium]|nr:hypothetical protein [Rickettsiales bacterium]
MNHSNQKIIFLDIDGVISTARAQAAFHKTPRAATFGTTDTYDPVVMGLLNRLCADHGAKVVLTSSEAAVCSREEMEELFYGQGFTGQFHDDWCIDDTMDILRSRGSSIVRWCEKHHIKPSDCIIFDDTKFSLPRNYATRFIKTHPADGMSFDNFEKGESLLAGKQPQKQGGLEVG